jgi:nucleoside-diphosphate-sugar epimerase
MRLLVLGGTHHVGRAAVETALARGDEVTTVNRGLSRQRAAGTTPLVADRTAGGALASALGEGVWDAVLDTWSGAPRVVRESARLLSGRVRHYGYVSSRSVYRWPFPLGADESAPVADADPDSDDAADYQGAKRGAELAVLESFGNAALLARPGLILGPYELTGRLPWWLGRLAEGGRVLAPGPHDRPLQYIDGRDLAAWMLSAADQGLGGTFNTVSRAGHATMGSLLEACVAVTGAGAELVWAGPELIEAVGIQAWTELPIWLPPTGEGAGMHDGDVSAAYAAGLRCRPVAETVADTWDWLQTEGWPPPRPDRPPNGLDRAREEAVLAGLGAPER